MGDSLVVLDLKKTAPKLYQPATNIFSDPTNLAKGLDATLSVLELWGSVFTKLKIEITLTSDGDNIESVEKIAAAVNKFCSKASQTIHLTISAYHNIEFEFPHATEVEYVYEIQSPDKGGSIDLIKIFPSMEKLRTSSLATDQLDFHFEHLIQIEWDNLNENIEEPSRNFKSFVKKNRQLRGVKAPMFCNFPYVAEVKNILPDLSSLGIHYNRDFYVPFEEGTDVIHLEDVTEFTVNLNYLMDRIPEGFNESFSKLRFGKLDSFKLTWRINALALTEDLLKSKTVLLDLIKQQPQLTTLAFQSFVLSDAELVDLMSKLPNVNTLQVSCSQKTVGEIGIFLADTKLSTLAIYYDNDDRGTILSELLSEKTKSNWEIHAPTKEEPRLWNLNKKIELV